MKTQKKFLLCLISGISITMQTVAAQRKATLPPVKEITITAQRDFLHARNARCLLKINSATTVVTPNDMDADEHIILDEKRNSAIVQIQRPKDDILQITANFECNCFTTDYTILYSQLADNNNIIRLNDDSTEISKPLTGHNSYKTICSKNKQPLKVSAEEVRPGAVVTPPAPAKMTIADILREYHDSRHILQVLKREGYNQSNLTQKQLELPGKLTDEQIKYIMERLPLNKNINYKSL